MLVVKNRQFARYAKQEKISDETLLKAINNIENGLIDADLGGGLIKQRLPRKGGGKSGGYRSIIAFKHEDRAIFLHGFAKSEKENINRADLQNLKGTAKVLLDLSNEFIDEMIKNEKLIEVKDDK